MQSRVGIMLKYASTVRVNEEYFFSDLADLETKENRLDECIISCTKQLKHLTEDAENSRYPLL